MNGFEGFDGILGVDWSGDIKFAEYVPAPAPPVEVPTGAACPWDDVRRHAGVMLLREYAWQMDAMLFGPAAARALSWEEAERLYDRVQAESQGQEPVLRSAFSPEYRRRQRARVKRRRR